MEKVRPFLTHAKPFLTKASSSRGRNVNARMVMSTVRTAIGRSVGASAYLFPGTICPIMETARSTALAAKVAKTAIRCTPLRAAQPAMPDGATLIATTPRKIIAHAPRKKRAGANGRTG